MRRAILILTLVAACGTPQEQCINRVTRDLRVVDRLITTAEGNLKRGYALEEVTITRTVVVPCQTRPPRPVFGETEAPEPPSPSLCSGIERDTETRPKAINLRAEAETLASLRVKRAELARDSASAIAQCKAEFPET